MTCITGIFMRNFAYPLHFIQSACSASFFCIFSSLAPGTWISLSLVFTKSLPQPGRSVLQPGDWQILLVCFYIPAPFTESFDRLGRRIVFASKVPEQESNSSYTAQVDPFPSALSTRPTLLGRIFSAVGIYNSRVNGF